MRGDIDQRISLIYLSGIKIVMTMMTVTPTITDSNNEF
jgi:hypothetical protein